LRNAATQSMSPWAVAASARLSAQHNAANPHLARLPLYDCNSATAADTHFGAAAFRLPAVKQLPFFSTWSFLLTNNLPFKPSCRSLSPPTTLFYPFRALAITIRTNRLPHLDLEPSFTTLIHVIHLYFASFTITPGFRTSNVESSSIFSLSLFQNGRRLIHAHAV
jgi:hypothetical protein